MHNLRTPSRDLALLIGTAPISDASHRAGNLLPLDLRSPRHTLALAAAYAVACGLALATVAYAFLAYANAPLPAPTGARVHTSATHFAYVPAPRTFFAKN